MDPRAAIALAAGLARPFAASVDCTAGTVAAVLVTAAGDVFTGVCVDTACSLGCCVEHAPVAEMLKARRSEVRPMVAATSAGAVLPPCGRCREPLWQAAPRNVGAWVVLGPADGAMLGALLPRR